MNANISAFLKKYPFYGGENIVTNAVTYEPVNRRDAYVIVNSVTGNLVKPAGVYSATTVNKIMKGKNPSDPYTRKPLVTMRGVEGAVMFVRAPKGLRKLMDEAVKTKSITKKTTKTSTKEKTRPLATRPKISKPFKVRKSVKITIYKSSFRKGARINDEPYITRWRYIKKIVLAMVAHSLHYKADLGLAKWKPLPYYTRETRDKLYKYIGLYMVSNPDGIFGNKGYWTKTLMLRHYTKISEDPYDLSKGNLKSATLDTMKRAFIKPHDTLSEQSKINLPVSTSNN